MGQIHNSVMNEVIQLVQFQAADILSQVSMTEDEYSASNSSSEGQMNKHHVWDPLWNILTK